MKELLDYIVKGILGNDNSEIKESNDESRIELTVLAEKEDIGLLIGKGGSTVRSIRNLLRVRSTLDKTGVYLSIEEKV